MPEAEKNIHEEKDSNPRSIPSSSTDLGCMTQWQMIRLGFSRHKLAVCALFILVTLYTMALFADFVAPYSPSQKFLDHLYAPPSRVEFSFSEGFHTHPLELRRDPVTLSSTYMIDHATSIKLQFLPQSSPYKLWGILPLNRHLFGVTSNQGAIRGEDKFHAQEKIFSTFASSTSLPVASSPFFLIGADKYGRDLFSRIVHGARISLSIGLFSISISFLLGVGIGGMSGYFGGLFDLLSQRLIEVLQAIPQLPLWIALGAVLPADWPPLWTYWGITVVLSLIGWTGLARTVRSKLLSLREEDYAVAARLLGASHNRIIFRHLVPGFTSHIIVTLTLAIPGMILGETALSFLGLGLRPPLVSWGVMLQDCLNLDILCRHPWLIVPTAFVILTVLSFNFVGDGLRDAADPYHAGK